MPPTHTPLHTLRRPPPPHIHTATPTSISHMYRSLPILPPTSQQHPNPRHLYIIFHTPSWTMKASKPKYTYHFNTTSNFPHPIPRKTPPPLNPYDSTFLSHNHSSHNGKKQCTQSLTYTHHSFNKISTLSSPHSTHPTLTPMQHARR